MKRKPLQSCQRARFPRKHLGWTCSYRLIAVTLLSCVAASCNERLSRTHEGVIAVHPQRNLLESTKSPGLVVRQIRGAQGVRETSIPSINIEHEGKTIAVPEGRSRHKLGEIVDGLVTAEGEILVLDRSFGLVRTYARNGDSVGVFGGLGGGKGKFLQPVGLDRSPDGGLVVIDRAGRRAIRYRADEDSTSVENIALQFVPEDGCILSDTLLVVGARLDTNANGDVNLASTAAVHLIGKNGGVIRSFGTPYHARSRWAAQALSRNRIVCDHAVKRVWSLTPVLVRFIRTRGTVRCFGSHPFRTIDIRKSWNS